jgi:short-subunit dehydrogenase
VINVSSYSSWLPIYGLVTYAGTKACMDQMIRCLALEGLSGIHIINTQPVWIDTAMADGYSLPLLTATCRECVNGSFLGLGYDDVCLGSAKHEILHWLFTCLPKPVMSKLFSWTMKFYLEKIRKPKD